MCRARRSTPPVPLASPRRRCWTRSRPRARRAAPSAAAPPAPPAGTSRCAPHRECAFVGGDPLRDCGSASGAAVVTRAGSLSISHSSAGSSRSGARPCRATARCPRAHRCGRCPGPFGATAVGVAEVAQHQALRAGEPVESDVLCERHRALVHVAYDGLGEPRLRRPRDVPPIELVGVLEQLVQRLGPGTSSSSSIRSSYSIPSAFISPIASPRALCSARAAPASGPRAWLRRQTPRPVHMSPPPGRGCRRQPVRTPTAAGSARS